MLRAIHELNPSSASQYSKSQYFNRRRPGDKPRGRYIIRGTPRPLPGRLYGERAAANSRRGEQPNLGTAKFRLGHWGLKCGHHLFAAGEQTAARSNGFYLGPAAFRPIGAGQNDTEPWTRQAVSDRRRASTTALAIAHRRDGRLVPVKVRPDVGASLATGLTCEDRSALIAIEWLQR